MQIVRAALIVMALGNVTLGQNRNFDVTITQEVPARGAFGTPPRRTKEIDFKLPENFEVVRDDGQAGATVSDVNFGGLTEIDRNIERIDRGVRLKWRLKNEHSFPVTGRKATLTLSLSGRRIGSMILSEKYKEIRARFLKTFEFDGRVAEYLNPNSSECHLKFADQTIYLGFALMAFSTEHAILRDAGQNTDETTQILSRLLDALDELDLAANKRYNARPEGQLNGFVARDDVELDDPRVDESLRPICSDWQANTENATPSGDQIFGIMFDFIACRGTAIAILFGNELETPPEDCTNTLEQQTLYLSCQMGKALVEAPT